MSEPFFETVRASFAYGIGFGAGFTAAAIGVLGVAYLMFNRGKP
jgi:hypothetical protein